MLSCQEEGSSCFHHRLLKCIEQDLNYEAQGILEKTDNLCDAADASGKSLLHYCVQYSNGELAKSLVEKGCNVDAQDVSGMTPLMLSVKTADSSVAEILLKCNADIYLTDSNGVNALQRSLDIIIELLTTDFMDQVFRYSYKERVNHRLILQMIIKRVNDDFLSDEEATMKFLLNASDKVKLAIVAFCDIGVATFILQNGFSIDFREPKLGLTAIHCAAMLGKFKNAKLLIEHGANIEAVNKTGLTPLMLAAENARATVTELLLKNNADIYATYSSGPSAFQRSFYMNVYLIKLPVAKFLNTADKVRESHERILDMFIDKVNQDFLANKEATSKLLLNANNLVKLAVLSSCNTELSTIILENGYPIEFREPKFGLTALHCAGILGKVENTQFLIERGTNVNATDEAGVTPLMLAVKKGYASVVELLLNNNANAYATDSDGVNALQLSLYANIDLHESLVFLHSTMIGKQRRVLDMIVNKMNEQFLADKEGIMKLLLNSYYIVKLAVVACCNTELASFVLENNYNIEFCESKLGFTALHCAVFLGKLENVKFLIERGANIDALNADGHSSLHSYTHTLQFVDENSEVLKILLKRSGNLQLPNNRGTRDIKHLLQTGTKETVKTVLDNGIGIATNLTSSDIQWLLMENAYLKVSDIEELGITIDVSLLDSRHGCSILMSQALSGNVAKVKYLLEHGADVHQTEVFEASIIWTVAVTAYSENCDKVIELLLQFGAANAETICALLKYLLQHPQKESLPIKPLVAHLAMLAAIDQSALIKCTCDSIDADSEYKAYFDLCLEQLEELKNIVLYKTVTLFDLLQEEQETLSVHARDKNFMKAYETLMENMSNLESYYVDTFNRRVANVIEKANEVKKVEAAPNAKKSSRYHCILM